MKIKRKIEIKKSDLILLIGVLIIIISFVFIRLFACMSEPILLDYAKKKSTNMISNIINTSINEIIYKKSYDNIIEIEKDNNSNIVSLDFNNKVINEILYLVTDDILNNITLIEKENIIYYIPIGVIHNNSILVNIGPKIPFKIDFLGSVNNETLTEVKEYGINSSMIEIFVIIDLKVQVIMPFRSETVDISKKVLLDSKIVQGKIPNYYGGLISSPLK